MKNNKKIPLLLLLVLVIGVTPAYPRSISPLYIIPGIIIFLFILPIVFSLIFKTKFIKWKYEDIYYSLDFKMSRVFLITLIENCFLVGLVVLFFFIGPPVKNMLVSSGIILTAIGIYLLFFPLLRLNRTFLLKNKAPSGKNHSKHSYLLSAAVPLGIIISMLIVYITYPLAGQISIFISTIIVLLIHLLFTSF